tara:strand:+ start:37 stop:207 length:171 start_codon:yes stop_codon:yes gene_type:complete
MGWGFVVLLFCQVNNQKNFGSGIITKKKFNKKLAMPECHWQSGCVPDKRDKFKNHE